jgi:hypothetical protein
MCYSAASKYLKFTDVSGLLSAPSYGWYKSFGCIYRLRRRTSLVFAPKLGPQRNEVQATFTITILFQIYTILFNPY